MAYRDTTNNRLYVAGKTATTRKKRTQASETKGMGPPIPTTPWVPAPYVNTPTFGSGNQSLPELRSLQQDSLVNAYDTYKDRSGIGMWSGGNDQVGVPTDPNLDYTGTGGGLGGGGSNGTSWEGWASQFAPGGADILYDNPEILVRQRLKEMGFNTDAGIMDLIGQDAGDLQYLAMLTSGAQPGSLESQTDSNFFNFAGDWAKQMSTPGGSVPDTMAMLKSILDAPGGSALAAALANGTPQEQAAMLNNMVSVAAGGLTPLMQKALMGRMQDRTTDWLGDQAKGRDSTLADWLQRGGQGYLG